MAVITPVGKFDFDWSPKESAEMVKTASTEAKEQKTDKDALYEAAKQVIASSKEGFIASKETSASKPGETSESKPAGTSTSASGGTSTSASGDTSTSGGKVDVGASKSEVSKGETSGTSAGVSGVSGDTSTSAGTSGTSAGTSVGVSKAVEVLLEKVEKSKDIVEKVDAAMGKVEQAVEEVKAAVGETSGGTSKALDIPEAGPAPEIPVVPEEAEFEVSLEEEKPEIGGEDIVQTSLETTCSNAIKDAMKKEAAVDDLVKTSKLSPTTRTKLMEFWKNKLRYDPEYCKIWFADNK